jgi:hypothetical protein
MQKTIIICIAIAIVSTAAIRIGPIILQRMSADMQSVYTMQDGELTYLVNPDGSATLRLGDGVTPGGRILADPAQVRVAPQRTLNPYSEYTITPYGGATANEDGSYSISAAACASGGIRIVSQTLPLSSVQFSQPPITEDDRSMWIMADPDDSELVLEATNVVTITASTAIGITISNLCAFGWIDRIAIGHTNDYRNSIIYADSAIHPSSPTTLGQMQTWLASNEGRHWSLWPAMRDLILDGFGISFGGAADWAITTSTNGLLISKNGLAVLTAYGSTTTNAADAVQIRSASVDSNNIMTMLVWTAQAPTRAPVIASCTNLVNYPIWLPYPAISNSWPETVAFNGSNCTYISCAAPAGSRLFRVFAALPGDVPAGVNVRSLRIDGFLIYLHTNGVVMWQ